MVNSTKLLYVSQGTSFRLPRWCLSFTWLDDRSHWSRAPTRVVKSRIFKLYACRRQKFRSSFDSRQFCAGIPTNTLDIQQLIPRWWILFTKLSKPGYCFDHVADRKFDPKQWAPPDPLEGWTIDKYWPIYCVPKVQIDALPLAWFPPPSLKSHS